MAATRFYFPNTGAAPLSPAFGAWNSTTATVDRIALVSTKIGSTMTTKGPSSAGTNGQYMLMRQYVGAPLDAQTISGNIKLVSIMWPK